MVDLKQNMHFMYWLMKASEGLLEAAIDRTTAPRLLNYFTHHLAEERHHADWLRTDLKNLDVPLSLDYRAAAIAGSQYYLIFHHDPALLLGYMHALEAWPKPLDKIDALEAVYGPLFTLRYHAVHDPEHTKDLEIEIAALPKAVQAQIHDNRTWIQTWIGNVLSTMDEEKLCIQTQL